MAQQDRSRIDFAYKAEQVIPVGVGGEIEVIHFTHTPEFAGAWTEDKVFTLLGCAQLATRGVGVGVTDEEDGVALIADHSSCQIMGGCVFAHHAGSYDKDASAGELHVFGLALFKHHQV